MKIRAIFSKYMEGQQVSAYDKNDNIIDGFVRVHENKKYIIDDNGKAYLMTEMKKIKQVGRKLNEEAEKAYSDALQQFSDYYNDTFDTEKVEKAGDTVKEKIINQYADTSEDSSVKTNKEAFVKDALDAMNSKAAEQQIEAGNSTVDMEIEKLKKDADDGELEESLFDNRRIQKAILREMELEKTEGSDYLQPRSDYGLGKENREDALDACAQMIFNGAGKDEVVEDLQLDYEMSKDEATNMYDNVNVDLDEPEEEKIKESNNTDIENKFEEALNNIPKELYGKNCVVEYLAECFKLDAKKALNESKDIGEAIYNLLEQAKTVNI